MFRSSSETTTSTISEPLSPFSNCSVPSEPTSDELEVPDLGAFTTVLRELNYLQPTPRAVNTSLAQQQSSFTHSSLIYDRSHSDLESDSDLRQPGPTVWSHRPIASYLSVTATDTETDQELNNRLGFPLYPRLLSPSESPAIPSGLEGSGTEGEIEPQTVPIDEISDLDYHSAFNDDDDDDDDLRNDHSITEELDEQNIEQPSLGYLDEALSFIVAERERWNAQREAGAANANSGDADPKWKDGVETRRKRRRKRTKTPRAHSTTRTNSSIPSSSVNASSPNSREEGDIDADDSSSSYDHYSTSNNNSSTSYLFKSTPATPSRRRDRGRQKRQQHGRGLRNSRSTPQLRLVTDGRTLHSLDSDVENPRVQYMRALAKKLVKIFPEDKQTLAKVQFKTLLPTENGIASPGGHHDIGLLGGYVDTRGPSPKGDDERLIHVFVDHSNILIGLLNYLKRYPQQHPQYRYDPASSPTSATPLHPKPPRHLSHSALTLILERGRPVTRRVLVTSSPLYQSMESAEQLGFEVRIYARVPDMGDGMDREKGHARSTSAGSGGDLPTLKSLNIKGRNGSTRKQNHSRKLSGSTSTESEQGSGGFPNAFLRSLGSPSNGALSASLPSSLSTTALVAIPGNGTSPPSSTPRIRYREQGVDELLQLKLHQALASIDGPPPPNSTIILATGDGNVGQFNEDGFLGSVRTALKKGWRVELYAWEGGLSKSWKREFGQGSEWGTKLEGESEPRFKVIGMEQFGAELVEIYF